MGPLQSTRKAIFPRGGLALWLLFFAGCTIGAGKEWLSPLQQGHPLVGRVWDVTEARFIEIPALTSRLARSTFVLLGEKHDNADHHRLQARIVNALVAAGRHPAVAIEMLSVDSEPALAEVLARTSVTSNEVRDAVRWEETGWPKWRLYRPIFEAALQARLPIAAADLSQSSVDSMLSNGLDGLEPALFERLSLGSPLPEARRQELSNQVRTAHCGHAPGDLVERMVDVQLARDAHLARKVVDASLQENADGAVLIAGTGHVRNDWGAPIHIGRWVPDATVVSVAFLEVVAGITSPVRTLAESYGETIPFDYVWFTPRVDDVDPCEKFRKNLHKLGGRLRHRALQVSSELATAPS